MAALKPVNIDLFGSWDRHVDAVHDAIAELDRRAVESMARATQIAVTNGQMMKQRERNLPVRWFGVGREA